MPGIGRIVGKAAVKAARKKAKEPSVDEVARAAMRSPPRVQRVDGTESKPGMGLPATAVGLGIAGGAKMLAEKRAAKKRK